MKTNKNKKEDKNSTLSFCGTAALFLLCHLVFFRFAGNLFPKSLRKSVNEPHIPIIDTDFLRGCPGILFQSFSHLHSLDEGMYNLRSQFRDFCVLSGVLHESSDVAAGVS